MEAFLEGLSLRPFLRAWQAGFPGERVFVAEFFGARAISGGFLAGCLDGARGMSGRLGGLRRREA